MIPSTLSENFRQCFVPLEKVGAKNLKNFLRLVRQPVFDKGMSVDFKGLHARCDAFMVPVNPFDDHYVEEFQLYFDQAIFNRVESARNIAWKHLNSPEDCRRKSYKPVRVRGLVIFGDRSHFPDSAKIHPEIRYRFLDEMLEELRKRKPDSPLLRVFAPLIEKKAKLEKNAATHYREIRDNPKLNDHQREVYGEVFIYLLLERFKDKPPKDFTAMIADLTPLKETRFYKEVRKEEQIALVRKMHAKGQSVKQIADLTDLSAAKIREFLNGAASNS